VTWTFRQPKSCPETPNSYDTIFSHVRLGEPFEEQTTDGRKCRTTVTMDGNKLITDQLATKEGEKDVKAVRTYLQHNTAEFMSSLPLSRTRTLDASESGGYKS